MRYRFVAAYQSAAGTWDAGEEVDLAPETAAWLLRDVPGCIEPVEPETRQRSKPQNRQVTAPKRNRKKASD